MLSYNIRRKTKQLKSDVIMLENGRQFGGLNGLLRFMSCMWQLKKVYMFMI